MLIYRIQSFQGEGAYSLPICTSYVPRVHLLPLEDAKLGPFWQKIGFRQQRQWYFGFGDMEQMHRWFPYNTRENFARYNAQSSTTDDKKIGVAVYDCLEEDCVVGDTQAVFIKDRAQWVEFTPFVMAKELVC